MNARLLAALLWGIASPAVAEIITFGKVDSDPRGVLPGLNAMAAAVAERVDGAEAGPAVSMRTLDEMADAMADGRVRYTSETPFGALELERRVGARLLLREWRKGVSRYRSVILAAEPGPLRSLDDLRPMAARDGLTAAFEDPGSTSAFFLPAAALLDAGLSLRPLAGVRAESPPGPVGFGFVFEEMSVSFAVASGVADIGGISEDDLAEILEDSPEMEGRLRVIHFTPHVIRSVLIAGPAANPARDEDVIAAIFALQETEAGRETLYGYNLAQRYDRLTGEAAVDLIAARRLREAAKALPPG